MKNSRIEEKLMFKNIIEFTRRKYVGVDLFNGNLKAFEKNNIYIDKPIEEIYTNVLNINNKSYWHEFNTIKQLLTYASNNTKKSLFRPILFIAYPFEFKSNHKDLLVNAASQSKWSQAYIIDNFLCAAIGANIGVDECKRKIFVYSLNNLTYMGLVFAGGTYNVNILEKGYDELTEIDINNTTEKLLNEVSIQLPEEFANLKISPKDLDEVSMGWKLEIESKIYLCTSPELKNKFGLNIGTYQLVYIEYENSILEGLKKITANVETGNNYTATRIN